MRRLLLAVAPRKRRVPREAAAQRAALRELLARRPISKLSLALLSHNLTHRLATRPPIKEEAHSASRASNAHDDGETVEDGGGRKVWSLDYAASQSRDRVIKAPQGSRPNAVLSNIPKKNGRGRIPR